MQKLGSSVPGLEAKIFGGAAVLPTSAADSHVGTRNVEFAVSRLAALRIPGIARRTGAKTGLAVRLFADSGDVLIRAVALSLKPDADVPPVHEAGRRHRGGGSKRR